MKIAFSYDPNLIVDSENKDIIFDLASRAIYARGVKYSTESIANYRPIYVNGTLALENNTAINIIAGTNISIIPNLGNITISVPNIDGIYINKLTDYVKASTIADLTNTDSLNIALGKLEHKTDLGITAYELVTAANDGDTIDNLQEILKVLEGIKDTSTIQQILGNYILKTDNIDWSKIINTPTTLAGYGITDWQVLAKDGESIDNYKTTAGIYRWGRKTTSNTPDAGGYGNSITLYYPNRDTWGQLYIPYNYTGYATDGIWWRCGTTSDTGAWRKILDDSNFSSYALPLTGGTMDRNTGITWDNGYYDSDAVGSHLSVLADTIQDNSLATQTGYRYNAVLNVGGGGIDSYRFQMASYAGGGNFIFYRGYNGNSKIWSDWVKIIHSGNIGSQSVSYATSAGDASTLGGQNGNWYRANCLRFARTNRTNNNSEERDANVIFDRMLYNYGSVTYWKNAPTNFLYGQILALSSYGDNSLAGQLAWDVNHNSTTDTTRSLWWRATDAGDWIDSQWHKIAFTDSNVASATKLATERTIWGQSFDGTGNVSGDLYLGKAIIFGYNGKSLIEGGETSYAIGYGYRENPLSLWASTFKMWTTSATALFINSSGNTTLGSNSDLATTNYKLYVNGKSYMDGALTVSGQVIATTFIGNIDGQYVNKLTGYAIANSASNLSTTDTLNSALGKLEYKVNSTYNWYQSVTGTDTDNVINKWHEIVDFVNNITTNTDLTDEFVTRKTAQTISGKKTFSNGLAITSGSENTAMPYFLGIDAFVDGGTVRWINANKVAAAIGALTLHQSLTNYVTLNTNQTITGAKNFRNDLTLNANNENRYITFYHTGGTGYDWRIGYLGSGNDDANYFVILSDKTDGTYVNALRIGLTTLASVFGGTVTASKFITSGGKSTQFVKGDGSLDSNTYATTTLLGLYLPLTGGTMTGPIRSDSGYVILNPISASYHTMTSAVSGCITINLPASLGNTMVSMWIDVYVYETQKSFSIHCGGYTYNNSTWSNSPFAIVYGANHRVRLGHNGTQFVVYIGETNTAWSYPQVSVRNVTLGYSPTLANWAKAWSISFSTSVNNVTYDTTTYAWTTKNLSKSEFAAASHRHTKLYRRDDSSDYSVQHHWTGTYWYLRGYSGDSYHAGVQVDYATSAGTANSVAWSSITGKPSSYYSLPLAASGTRGGIQIGYTDSGANIALKLSSEKGYVTLTKTAVTTALGYTPPSSDTNTWRPLSFNSTSYSGSGVNFTGGTGISLSVGAADSGGQSTVTISPLLPKSGSWFNDGLVKVSTSGVAEIGRYIDFHPTNTSTLDYSVRIDSGTSTTARTFTLGTTGGTLAITADNNKTGNTTTTSKIYPVGTTSTSTTAGNYAQTYTNTNFYVNSSGVFWTSDRKFKDCIKSPVKNGMLDDETGLIRKFNWKDTGKSSYGFIAQELLPYVPEAVDYDEELNKYSVNYDVAHSALIAQLIIKVKELEEEILRLKQLIN